MQTCNPTLQTILATNVDILDQNNESLGCWDYFVYCELRNIDILSESSFVRCPFLVFSNVLSNTRNNYKNHHIVHWFVSKYMGSEKDNKQETFK